MNLLAAKLYDPAGAVSKATSALLAMTAFDTTNLRLTVTVPAHGMLRIKMGCVITGATTVPTIFLGVMNGSTVVGRVNPCDYPGTMNAATQTSPCWVDFVVTGLTPGSITLDAAYGVEVVVASTNIKYGGPNDTTTNNAWGAFQYEIWDPQPMATAGQLSIDASGRVDVIKVAGTTQTARDLGAQLDATVSSRLATSGYTAPDNASITTLTTRLTSTRAGLLDNLDAAISSRLSSVGYTAPDNAGITTLVTRLTTTRAANLDNLDAAISTRSTYAGGDTAGTTTLLGRITAIRAGLIDNLDAAISSRLSTVGYTAPDNTGVATLLTRLSGTRAALLDNIDAAVSSRLASAGYTAPDNASVVAIKAKTDSLAFTIPGKLDVGLYHVNGVTITGTGTSVDPWRA